MNEQQKRLVAMLNDMYYSQGDEYKSRYRDNYFELLQHISSTPSAYITGKEIRARINGGSRLFGCKTKQKDGELH